MGDSFDGIGTRFSYFSFKGRQQWHHDIYSECLIISKKEEEQKEVISKKKEPTLLEISENI